MKNYKLFVGIMIVLIFHTGITDGREAALKQKSMAEPSFYYTPKYTFKGDIAVKIEYVSSNGKFNYTYFYENRKLVKIEKDSDGDGEPDIIIHYGDFTIRKIEK